MCSVPEYTCIHLNTPVVYSVPVCVVKQPRTSATLAQRQVGKVPIPVLYFLYVLICTPAPCWLWGCKVRPLALVLTTEQEQPSDRTHK